MSPQYKYSAKSVAGEEKKGVREADDEFQLARMFHKEGFILISAEIAGTKKKFRIALPKLGVSLKDKIFFCKNLQVMSSAGLPLPRSIGILAEQSANKIFRRALERIREDVTKGNTFSDALAKYPQIFSEFFQSMVKVGEETGTLENVLVILVSQMEKEYSLNSKIKGAMVYPAVIVCAMIGVGALMLITVVPTLSQTFKELNVSLPATTQFVMALAAFVQTYWWLTLAIVIVFIFIWMQVFKTKIGKKISGSILLKLPAISEMVRNINSAYTTRNLSSLIGAGVSLPRALEITADTVQNVNYRAALIDVRERVKKGEKFSDAIKDYRRLYPATAIQMIAVGEETGETSNILKKLADFYENEVDEATKNFTAIIEPVLMIVIGVVVGFFAVSMIQPMYSMMDVIQ